MLSLLLKLIFYILKITIKLVIKIVKILSYFHHLQLPVDKFHL